MYLDKLYGTNCLFLLTDLYQLTMAYGYWKQGRKDDEAVFHQFFRSNPFGGGYAVAAGMGTLKEFTEHMQGLSTEGREYLSTLKGNDGEPLFEKEFLDYLQKMKLDVEIDAVEEGTVVFPHEPLVRVKGPLIQCQLLETALLNIINFQTLIATKSARICEAAQGEPVLEFGLRRAQGIDGAIMASRAAYIGGCAGTSNVLAGHLLDIPVKGTHAHSWVMSYDSETEAFEEYAKAMPNNCVFLVDTYDTLRGVKKAIEVGKKLRFKGHEMVGIRLDSGDLAYLSKQARKLLDEAGFEDAKIVASNGLDERTIESLKRQDAQIRLWGVGTNLVTAKGQPALGGVYKLSAIRRPDEDWQPRIKLSEQRIKISNPGQLQVCRYYDGETYRGDMIFNQHQVNDLDAPTIVDPMDNTRRTTLDFDERELLLKPLHRPCDWVSGWEKDLSEIQGRTKDQLAKFHGGIRRFDNPHEYPVGLSKDLHELRTKLILENRKGKA